MARKNVSNRGRKHGGGPPAGRSRGPPRSSRPDGFGAGAYSALAQVIQRGPAHSMADEARNTTKRPRGVLGQDAKLRHKPVTFVSAGFMDPLEELKVVPPEAGDVKPDKTEPGPDEVDQRPSRVEQDLGKVEQDTIPDPAGVEPTPRDSPSVSTPALPKDDVRPSSPQLFIVDTAGDKSLRPDQNQPSMDMPGYDSDQNSDSSEEVILFKGRDAALRKAVTSRAMASPKPKETTSSIQLREIDAALKVVEKTITEDHTVPAEEKMHPPRISINDGTPSATPKPPEKELVSLEALLDKESDEEAALIADYIANMNTDEEADEDEDDAETDAHPGLGSYAFHPYRDLGGNDGDAIPKAVSEGEAPGDELEDDAGSTDIQQRRLVLKDEHMARILAKQEELGLRGDDIVLYDDADSEDDQGEWQIAPKSPPRRKKKGSAKKDKIIQKMGQYPSATAMAEAFDDMDLMDWQRASLDNFNQSAKRSSRVHHASDSELEEAMNLSFQKDRQKKAEKKKEREALRTLGLLGKNIKPDDLRVKYPGGMAKEDILFELEQFLVGTDEQMSFPPFDKHARQLLHTVASHLKIKSQSSGSGESRYTVLYRTGRTIPYNERTLEAIVNRTIKRPHFHRVDVRRDVANQYLAASRKNSSAKRGTNAISYREGEVVGQHASEIASDNKGRLLLEKMGWSKGMALGTEYNKGIMVPIGHLMKKSKAGLGEV